MRVVSAGIGHETNTFSAQPTTLAEFQRDSVGFEVSRENPDGFPAGERLAARLRGTRTVHGGYLEGADRHGLMLTPLLLTWATPGGLVARDAFEHMKAVLLARLRAEPPCDGVLLDLHGAMVTETEEDAEGALIDAVRQAVGPRTPIVVTLDLHANVTARMAAGADAILGFDEYPHTDMFERGEEAAVLMAAIGRGEVRPALAFEPLPLITMPPRQCTGIEPMRSLLGRAHAMEARAGVLNVTLAMGFPFADIENAGVSVLVTANGDPDLARRQARAMAQTIWRRREEFAVTLTPVSEAIRLAQEAHNGPVILADGSDNPGGGGPCDGTVILQALLEARVQGAVVAVIADPEAVAQAVAAGVGEEVTLDLGGKTDGRHGAPVRLTARVRLLSDGVFSMQGAMGAGMTGRMGRAAVLVVDGVEIVVAERRVQPYDAGLLRSVGIEPERRRLIALKSAVHFRASYEPFAGPILSADTPGIHRPEFASFDYRRLRRPIYPLDPDTPYALPEGSRGR
jgi:microcystin degradation protein MlrC